MNTADSDTRVWRLIRVPAVIALAITALRLAGELLEGSSIFFNSTAGGGGALIGIVWLVPIFGVYFSVKLTRAGHPPELAWKVVGYAVLGLLAAGAIAGFTVALTGNPNVSMSLRGATFQQLGIGAGAAVAVLIQRKVWPAFFRTLLGFAFASRIPVVAVMFFAMLGNWGTHYELGPPGYPEMGFLTEFVLIAVMPQMTFWIMFTVIVGSLFGGITAVFAKPGDSQVTPS